MRLRGRRRGDETKSNSGATCRNGAADLTHAWGLPVQNTRRARTLEARAVRSTRLAGVRLHPARLHSAPFHSALSGDCCPGHCLPRELPCKAHRLYQTSPQAASSTTWCGEVLAFMPNGLSIDSNGRAPRGSSALRPSRNFEQNVKSSGDGASKSERRGQGPECATGHWLRHRLLERCPPRHCRTGPRVKGLRIPGPRPPAQRLPLPVEPGERNRGVGRQQ
jgi:hypothetical protein